MRESLAFLNKAIELNPTYTEALINRSFLKLNEPNKIEALKDLERAHITKPHIKQIWDLVITIKKIELEQFSEAISLPINMIEIDPNDEKLQLHKALCHQRLNQFALAEESNKQAIKIKPTSAEAYYT